MVTIEEFCRTELDTDMRWDIDEIVNMLEQINENTDMCNIVFVDEVTSVTKVDSSGNILLDLNPLSKLSTLARVHAVICYAPEQALNEAVLEEIFVTNEEAIVGEQTFIIEAPKNNNFLFHQFHKTQRSHPSIL